MIEWEVRLLEEIFIGEQLAGILIRSNYRAEGINFFTGPEFSQQLGYMNRPEGHVIAPHIHKDVKRQVRKTQEVLFIKSGRVLVEFYDDKFIYSDSRILEQGDIILLADCGHGFKMLEDSEIFEVKQGPYAGENDKIRFAGKNNE